MRTITLAAALVLLVVLAGCTKEIARADLEAALHQDGDAPAEWGAPGQIRDTLQARTDAGALLAASRTFPGAALDGAVAAAVYADTAKAGEAFRTVLPAATEEGSDSEIGDEGKERFSTVLWRRGRCVAYVRAPGTPNSMAPILSYARRLDERLQGLGC
jgi:hypothetical protein